MVYGNNVYIYGTHCYKKVTHDSITNGIRNNYYEYIELPEGKITIINGDLKTLVITDNSICCTCHDQHNNYDLQYSTSSKSWLIF